MTSDTATALDILGLMRLEDGRTWAETCVDYQRVNAAAILDIDDPIRQSWIEAPRGARKTTDLAGLLLSILLVQAPAMSRSYIGASDEDQAAELLDAARGLIARTAELTGLFTVAGLVITNNETGASFTALAADASAMGKRAFMVVLDEVASWPQTKKARTFWSTMMSGNRKIAECRTVVISNAGEPGSWQWHRRETARKSPRWRFVSVPAPLPWLTEDDLEVLRENAITDSEFARLHLNVWTEAEDRLASRNDLEACAVLVGEQPPQRGLRYVVTLDVGVTNDRSVVTVQHRAAGPEGVSRVVVDVVRRWQGSRAAPVDLAEVASTVRSLSREYNRAKVILDPYQAKLIAQQLASRGISVTEFTFSATSVGRLAAALHQAIRQRRIVLPRDEDLLDELATVRLVRNSVGVTRLDHDAGQHDDQAVSIALGVFHLLVPQARRVRPGLRAVSYI